MKFEISNSKLEQVIFKYLDNKNFIIRETDKNYYFLENEDNKYSNIRLTKKDMICLIYNELINEISSFFSIKTIDSKNVVGRYVENTLNIKVSVMSSITKIHMYLLLYEIRD